MIIIVIIIVIILVIYHPGENQLMPGNRLVGALSSVCGRKLQEIPEFAPTMNCNQPYKTSHTTKHTTVNNRPTIQYRENNQCNDATVKNQRHSESTYERQNRDQQPNHVHDAIVLVSHCRCAHMCTFVQLCMCVHCKAILCGLSSAPLDCPASGLSPTPHHQHCNHHHFNHHQDHYHHHHHHHHHQNHFNHYH